MLVKYIYKLAIVSMQGCSKLRHSEEAILTECSKKWSEAGNTSINKPEFPEGVH